jgi:hypothetical protein
VSRDVDTSLIALLIADRRMKHAARAFEAGVGTQAELSEATASRELAVGALLAHGLRVAGESPSRPERDFRADPSWR